jgi:hypothetical protein
MTNWISIEDELPPNGELVLIADELSGFVTFGKYDEEIDTMQSMHLEGFEEDMIATHWAVKPEFYRAEYDGTY